jgi:hypothetical protein
MLEIYYEESSRRERQILDILYSRQKAAATEIQDPRTGTPDWRVGPTKKIAHTQWAHFVSAPSGLASIRSLPLQRDSAATFPDVSKIAQVHSPAAE